MLFKNKTLHLLLLGTVAVAACSDVPDPAGPARPDSGVNAAMGQSQSQLAGWFEKASPEVLALPGTVFADNDEANNRLLFGIENAAAANGVSTALEHLGIPSSAYAVVVTEPISQVTTLRDKFPTTQAGIQIHFGNYLCSLGFNADDGTERSFITASHCTNRQGGVEGTQYYQPTSTVDPTVIATEVEDPDYFTGGACPRGRKCRYSDAARALYNTSRGSTRTIAQTPGPNNGSLDVTGSFTVASQDNTTTNFTKGTTVNKVGRTTGWTQGSVTSSCVNVNVSGSRITQLCQTLVESPSVIVQGGDSGSGVFRLTGGNNVELVGILWGGNSNGTLFVFSPLKQVRDELGALVASP